MIHRLDPASAGLGTQKYCNSLTHNDSFPLKMAKLDRLGGKYAELACHP